MILETEVNYTVQSDSDVKILVAIDLGLVAKRNYVLPTSPQKDTIVFEYDYQNQTRYELNIFFSGESSDQKMLTLHSIFVNQQRIDPLNSYYYPEIDDNWWNSLDEEQKNYFKNSIYLNNGGQFGWFGRIKYEFKPLEDLHSLYKAQFDADWSQDYNLIGQTRSKSIILQDKKTISKRRLKPE